MGSYNLGEARGKIILETDFASLKDGQKALGDIQKAAGDSATSSQEAWRKTGTAATVAGATVVAAFGLAVNSASNFEFQLSAIQAVSGATADEMDLISAAALRIGKDTSFSASEAAQAMEELVKAGISTEDVLNGAADATVALAAAGGVDLPTAATIAANAMNQFNLTAEDMVGITDSIAGAANASAIDVNDLGMSMGQVGAVANLLGLSFDDTALAIAAMGNAGIKGSDAGTSLKTMLMNLQPTTDAAAQAMRELGLITEDGSNQFFTAEGSIKSMAEISDVLSGALAGMSDAQKQATLTTLFGTDAVRGAAIVANTGAEGFNQLSESMQSVSAADVAATRMDNLKGSTEELFGSVETLMITIGTALIPTVRDMVDGITQAVNWFGQLDASTQGAIVAATGIAGGLLLVFGAAIKLTQGIAATRGAILAITGATGLFTAATAANGAAQGASLATMVATKAAFVAQKVATIAMATAQGVATAAQWAFNAALTANPIGLIIMAIAALVAGLVWFFTQTELGQQIVKNVTQFIQEAWANVSSFLTTVWEGIVSVATTVWQGIQDVVGAVVTWFQTYVWPIIQFVIDMIIAYFTMYWNVVQAVWNGIMTVIGAVVSWFMTYVWPTIQAVIDFIVALFNYFWSVVQFVWQAVWDFLVTVVTAIVDFVIAYFTFWYDTISGILTAIWTFISDVWNNVLSFITTVVTNIVNAVVTWFTQVWTFISGIFNQVWNFIQMIWNQILSTISQVVSNVWNTISGTWNSIVGFVTGVFNDAYNAIKNPLEDALEFIGGMKDKIIGFFSGAGKWLWDAGAQIIDGFLKGLQSMWNEVGNFFRDLTSMIPETKGPPEKDKVLLTENGRLIMQSLANGLADEMGSVYGVLNGLNTSIPMSVQQDIDAQWRGNSASTQTPVVLNLEYHAAEGDGTKTKEDLMAMLGHATELVREELT